MGREPCCSKGKKKGAWTSAEDKILTDYIKVHGEGKWCTISKRTGIDRSGKSCRLRWLNYLRPDIKRGNITQDEEDLIIRLHKLLGNRWSLIAGRLPGRTDNEIKNYWNSNLSKRTQLIIKQCSNSSTSTNCENNMVPSTGATPVKTLSQEEQQLQHDHQVTPIMDEAANKILHKLNDDPQPLPLPTIQEVPDIMMGFRIKEDISISEFLESDFWNLSDFLTREEDIIDHHHHPQLLDFEFGNIKDSEFGSLASLIESSEYDWMT